MPFSLYAATIPTFQQMLEALSGVLGIAEAFCAERGIPSDDLVRARLADDMLSFAWQVKLTRVHSLGAIEGLRQGQFSPDRTPPPESLAALRMHVGETLAGLAAVEAAEVDAFLGRDVSVAAGDHRFEFVAENFLLSLSQPNFFFHATTAYDILRWKGLPLGKMNFMGKMRMKI